MRDTAGEVRTNSFGTFSNGPFHTDVQVLAGLLELSTKALHGHRMLSRIPAGNDGSQGRMVKEIVREIRASYATRAQDIEFHH